MSEKIVGRFAPTPSGRLHLGNLLCALLAWLSVRAQGGRMVLRIEDLDTARSRREYALQMEEDLLALGLDWDEGGRAGGPHGPYCQSERTARYAAAAARLEAAGWVYPCFCTRAQLHAAEAPHGSGGEPVYDGHCRGLPEPERAVLAARRAPALRLRVPTETIAFTDGHYGPVSQALDKECGDFVIRRADGIYAYQLAVVADDIAMEVTQVVRGRDLLASTPRQLYLYRLLGAKPPSYSHLPLLLAPDGRRLSKRDGDLGLDALYAKGLSPQDVVGRLAFAAGILERPEAAAPRDLIPLFSWDNIPREDIRLPAGLFDRSVRGGAICDRREQAVQGRIPAQASITAKPFFES